MTEDPFTRALAALDSEPAGAALALDQATLAFLGADAAAKADMLEQVADRLEQDLVAATASSPTARALVRALEQVAGGDDDAALDRLAEVSRLAREARDEASYVVATLMTSYLLERRGDRVGSFGALTIGWATLRAALGDERARAAFSPAMRDLRDRWGAAEFEAVAAEFHGRRPTS